MQGAPGDMTTSATTDFVYKIAPAQTWTDAVNEGVYRGSADDVRDGFIHLSARHQLEGTAAKYYIGVTNLVLIAINPSVLGAGLAWEASRGGDLFPHLYGELSPDVVAWVHPLPLGPDGVPQVAQTLLLKP
jgi:uncharacterized protein (DUF952 family)